MKPNVKLPLLALAPLALLTSCAFFSTNGSGGVSTGEKIETVSDNITGSFTMETSDGTWTKSGGIYTISSAGTYVLSGKLEGQIYIAAADEDKVELDLNGVSITYGENSPIFVESADEVKIKALKGTSNFVHDTRAEQSEESDVQGPGAIYAKADLKLAGQGGLTIEAAYNNGVHTNKDLEIKNLTLVSSAPNNAVKGNDSISILSGNVTAISYSGDGLKTTSTDLSSSSAQRGNVDISGGKVLVYAGGDGIDASYDVNVYRGIDEDDGSLLNPSLTIYTNKYSPYSSASVLSGAMVDYLGAPGQGGPGGGGGIPGEDGKVTDKADGSAKGIKAANSINVSGGSITVNAYDDGLHANYGEAFDSGAKGVGDIIITGGSVNVAASDDGLHADRYLKLAGGAVTVSTSHEGLEGNQIIVTSGRHVVYASDDGVNAGQGSSTAGLSALIDVSGGYLFAAVASSGDTDGIDSNGKYRQSGGTVIACGPNNMNAAALDTDGATSVTGGSLSLFGAMGTTPSTTLTKSSKSGSYGNKAYEVTFALGTVATEALPQGSSYSSCTAFSELGAISSIA